MRKGLRGVLSRVNQLAERVAGGVSIAEIMELVAARLITARKRLAAGERLERHSPEERRRRAAELRAKLREL